MNPTNLTLRFVLEALALGALGWWGWSVTNAWWRWLAAVVMVVAAAVAWGTFAVPNDPSRGSDGLVQVPGALRVAIELLFFGCATHALVAVKRPTLAMVYGALVLVHYAWSYRRVAWLLER